MSQPGLISRLQIPGCFERQREVTTLGHVRLELKFLTPKLFPQDLANHAYWRPLTLAEYSAPGWFEWIWDDLLEETWRNKWGQMISFILCNTILWRSVSLHPTKPSLKKPPALLPCCDPLVICQAWEFPFSSFVAHAKELVHLIF